MATAPLPDESPDEAIDRICRDLTTPTNEIDGRLVKVRFQAWLRAHPQTFAQRAPNVASAMVETFFRRRRPKVGAGQLGLFRPEAIVPIGGGKRAWMDDLSRDQFQAWEETETAAFSQTRAAFEGKVPYWQERRDRWGTHGTLGSLERADFGYVDLDISFDDDADDDEGD